MDLYFGDWHTQDESAGRMGVGDSRLYYECKICQMLRWKDVLEHAAVSDCRHSFLISSVSCFSFSLRETSAFILAQRLENTWKTRVISTNSDLAD